MIKKFLSKYILEVIPSIVATVVGAYIVTNYINNKAPAEKPPMATAAPAQAVATPETPRKDDAAAAKEVKAETKSETKAEATAKAAAKAAAERLASEKAATARTSAEKAETARKAAERRELEKRDAERREAEARAHALAKGAKGVPTAAEGVSGSGANDLARAAIERLRTEEPKAEAKGEPKAAPRIIEPKPVEQATRAPERRAIPIAAPSMTTGSAPATSPVVTAPAAAMPAPVEVKEVAVSPSGPVPLPLRRCQRLQRMFRRPLRHERRIWCRLRRFRNARSICGRRRMTAPLPRMWCRRRNQPSSLCCRARAGLLETESAARHARLYARYPRL